MSYCGVVLFFTQTEHQWILYIFKKVPQLLRSHNYFIVGKKNLDPPSDSNGYDETHIIISVSPHSSMLTISIGTKVYMAVLFEGKKNLSIEKKKESEVAQLCPTFCNPVDCSLPGSSIHGIFQARILE